MKEALKDHNFAEYFKYYIDLVEDNNLIDAIEKNTTEFQVFFDLLIEDQANYRYAADKWSIKELLVHLIDTERVFCYRALSFARFDKTDLLGFDHDQFVANSDADNRTLCDISKEFFAVRNATLHLFKNLTPKMLQQEGSANGNNITTSAVGYLIVGHAKHHINIIEERYLNE